jgi:membrane fusion protein (multidrug efflux system)
MSARFDAMPVSMSNPLVVSPFEGDRATRTARRAGVLVPCLLAVALLAACGKKDEAPAAGAPGGGRPPAEVGVVTVQLGSVPLSTELPGRLEASRVAEVRARAAGILQKRLFTEGSDVKAGQPLFTIDNAPYRAVVANSQAALQRSRAVADQAKATAQRYAPLVEANAISRQDYVNAVAAQKQAEADVAVAQASLQTSQISLGYASVTAPISGRIGRALVTEGALVGQGDATALAIVQQINPMYVNFTQSTSEVLRLRKGLESGTLKKVSGTNAAAVRIVLEDGSDYGQDAKLLFTDLTVDQTSGQVTLRAEVPNKAGVLLPGMYVRVRLDQAEANNAILLPQQAVTRSTTGDTVMVVSQDGKVAPRPVKVGTSQGTNWVVLDGLKPGEQVMVDGFQKLQGNAPVKAVPWQPQASGATAGGAPGGAAGGAMAPGGASAPAAGASAASMPASSASGR